MAHPPSTQTSRAPQTLLSTSRLVSFGFFSTFTPSHTPTRLCPIHLQRLVREAIAAHQLCSHTLLAPSSCTSTYLLSEYPSLCPRPPRPPRSVTIIPYTPSSKSRSKLVDPNPSGSLSPDSSPLSFSLFSSTDFYSFSPTLLLPVLSTSPIPHLQPNFHLPSTTFTMASRFVASRLASAARVNVAAASKRTITGE